MSHISKELSGGRKGGTIASVSPAATRRLRARNRAVRNERQWWTQQSKSNHDDFNMSRLAAESASALAKNRALMDAGLTWAADWRSGGKRFSKHTDGGRVQ